jgi:hypothetical protein
MVALALASCLFFQQLAEPYGGGHCYQRHGAVALPAADNVAWRNCASVCWNLRISTTASDLLQRTGARSDRHMVASPALRSTRTLSTTRFSQHRTAPVNCFCRHYNHCELHHRQPAHLCCCELHGLGDFLRADVPSGDGTGIHGSSKLSACARRMRSLSYWPGSLLVRP